MRLGDGRQIRKSRVRRRNPYARTARNIAISFTVLLLLVIAAGAAYTWYISRHNPKTASKLSLKPAGAPVLKAPKVAADVRESASVQMLTSPIIPGSNASITIQTLPNSNCTIVVTYNETIVSKDSGLAAKTADDYGVVNWTWSVEETVPVGTWPVKVVCERNKKTAMVVGKLKVVKTITEEN
jgi:hypothetical protein